QSKLIVMWAEGATRRLGLLRARMEAQARNEVFGGGVASPEWTKARESLADWERLVDTALGDAERMGQPLLIADSLLLRLESKIEQTLDRFLESCGESSTFAMAPDFRAGV